MKAKINAFLDGLILYDYILFGTVFVLFILFVVLGIALRKRVLLATVVILFAFGTLILGPTLGYKIMHSYLFKHSLELLSEKKLTFTKAVVVKGSITNDSKRYFKSCRITASAYKVTSNRWKNYIKKLKPFQKASISIYDIDVSQTREFKMFIEPFTYERDYNVSLGAECR